MNENVKNHENKERTLALIAIADKINDLEDICDLVFETYPELLTEYKDYMKEFFEELKDRLDYFYKED